MKLKKLTYKPLKLYGKIQITHIFLSIKMIITITEMVTDHPFQMANLLRSFERTDS